jgi:DeoR/GlpR family transcriptional regulator of sugar metabolism
MAKNSKRNIEDRRRRILELIAAGDNNQQSGIARMLGVSEMTFWRDMVYLEQYQFIQRQSSGFYVVKDDITVDPAFSKRVNSNRAEKDAIAKAALELIKDGDCLGIDSSSTALALSRFLAQDSKDNITVVTNSLMAPSILSESAKVHLIVAGGMMRADSFSTVGSVACSTIEHFNYDKAIISANGIDFQKGLCDTNFEEIATKMAFIKNAQETIVLLDSSKIGKRAFQSFCHLSAIDVLITDWHASQSQIDVLAKAGMKVIQALHA